MANSKHFEICDAPLCPEDKSTDYLFGGVELRVWYPDEPICNLRPFTDYQKMQKKIQKRYLAGTLKGGDDLYYDLAHFLRIKNVNKNTRGIDPRIRDYNPSNTDEITDGGSARVASSKVSKASFDPDSDSDHSAYSRTPDR